MSADEAPPTEAERLEAEELRRALDGEVPQSRSGAELEAATRARDPLAAAHLIQAAHLPALDDLRRRAVWRRAFPGNRKWTPRVFGALLGAAVAASVLLALRPQGRAELPAPRLELVRVQLEAARRGQGSLRPLDRELSAHRERLYGALASAYGGAR